MLSPLTHHDGVTRHRPLALALVAALSACALVVGVGAAEATPAGAGPGPPSGNKESAKACQKGGWQNLVRSDGSGFTSEEQCTSYAAEGGTLYNANEAPCLNGGYQNYLTSTGQSFASQEACVSYVRGGGTLQPKPTFEQQYETACEEAGGNFNVGSGWECFFAGPFEAAPSRGSLATICGQADGTYEETVIEHDWGYDVMAECWFR